MTADKKIEVMYDMLDELIADMSIERFQVLVALASKIVSSTDEEFADFRRQNCQ